MKKQMQAGFTLIELVVVIVILGILAAVAMPKFVDLRGDAETAAIKGVAGGLESANAINYAGCSVTNNAVTANKCIQVTKCSNVGNLMSPVMTIGTAATATQPYYLTADAASTTNGASITCTLNKAGGYSATFSATGAAN